MQIMALKEPGGRRHGDVFSADEQAILRFTDLLTSYPGNVDDEDLEHGEGGRQGNHREPDRFHRVRPVPEPHHVGARGGGSQRQRQCADPHARAQDPPGHRCHSLPLPQVLPSAFRSAGQRETSPRQPDPRFS